VWLAVTSWVASLLVLTALVALAVVRFASDRRFERANSERLYALTGRRVKATSSTVTALGAIAGGVLYFVAITVGLGGWLLLGLLIALGVAIGLLARRTG